MNFIQSNRAAIEFYSKTDQPVNIPTKHLLARKSGREFLKNSDITAIPFHSGCSLREMLDILQLLSPVFSGQKQLCEI